jgi:ATP-dependent protease ClpP protease subunit
VKGIRLEKKGKRLELDLYGTVGSIWDDGINAAKVVALLRNAEDVTEIECRINSMGGNAFDGIAIMNALKDHPAKVTVKVDGLAASAASIIAMAGDTIEMGDGAFMMVHQASALVVGNAQDMAQMSGILDKCDGEITGIYARRTGKSVETVRGWVNAETWFTGPEAVEAGLADKSAKFTKTVAAPAAHALAGSASKFKRVPAPLRQAIAAHYSAPKAPDPAKMAKLQAWHNRLLGEMAGERDARERMARRQAAGENPFVAADFEDEPIVNPFRPKPDAEPDLSNPFLPKGEPEAEGSNPFLPKGDD